MKTENNKFNKEAFFGAYMNVNVFRNSANDKYGIEPYSKPILNHVKNEYAELKRIKNMSDEDSNKVFASIEKTDELRRLGYATPWRDLSVQDLIDYGWIVIKQ